MKPYLNFAKAVIQDHDPSPELEVIRRLPLEKRYVWRVASALKWGLADCESLSVEADRQTLKPEGHAKIMELLKFRPMQLARFPDVPLINREITKTDLLQSLDLRF
jgi:hypothetical protein